MVYSGTFKQSLATQSVLSFSKRLKPFGFNALASLSHVYSTLSYGAAVARLGECFAMS